jgi:hypothetical protein
MFGRMLNHEKEHSKDRDEDGMAHICFTYHKEGHTTHDCSLIFLHKKKLNFERISVMMTASNRVERKKDERNPVNLALITEVKESSSMIDVDEIIIRNNITDLNILKILHDIAKSKNMKMDSFAPKVHYFQESQL